METKNKDNLTGKDIINNFGGDTMLCAMGFRFKEQGCNSHWHMTKTFHEKINHKNGYEIQGSCTGELILSTYHCGYIGLSFYIYDYRDYRNSNPKTIYQNLQVKSWSELKTMVNIFNHWII